MANQDYLQQLLTDAREFKYGHHYSVHMSFLVEVPLNLRQDVGGKFIKIPVTGPWLMSLPPLWHICMNGFPCFSCVNHHSHFISPEKGSPLPLHATLDTTPTYLSSLFEDSIPTPQLTSAIPLTLNHFWDYQCYMASREALSGTMPLFTLRKRDISCVVECLNPNCNPETCNLQPRVITYGNVPDFNFRNYELIQNFFRATASSANAAAQERFSRPQASSSRTATQGSPNASRQKRNQTTGISSQSKVNSTRKKKRGKSTKPKQPARGRKNASAVSSVDSEIPTSPEVILISDSGSESSVEAPRSATGPQEPFAGTSSNNPQVSESTENSSGHAAPAAESSANSPGTICSTSWPLCLGLCKTNNANVAETVNESSQTNMSSYVPNPFCVGFSYTSTHIPCTCGTCTQFNLACGNLSEREVLATGHNDSFAENYGVFGVASRPNLSNQHENAEDSTEHFENSYYGPLYSPCNGQNCNCNSNSQVSGEFIHEPGLLNQAPGASIQIPVPVKIEGHFTIIENSPDSTATLTSMSGSSSHNLPTTSVAEPPFGGQESSSQHLPSSERVSEATSQMLNPTETPATFSWVSRKCPRSTIAPKPRASRTYTHMPTNHGQIYEANTQSSRNQSNIQDTSARHITINPRSSVDFSANRSNVTHRLSTGINSARLRLKTEQSPRNGVFNGSQTHDFPRTVIQEPTNNATGAPGHGNSMYGSGGTDIPRANPGIPRTYANAPTTSNGFQNGSFFGDRFGGGLSQFVAGTRPGHDKFIHFEEFPGWMNFNEWSHLIYIKSNLEAKIGLPVIAAQVQQTQNMCISVSTYDFAQPMVYTHKKCVNTLDWELYSVNGLQPTFQNVTPDAERCSRYTRPTATTTNNTRATPRSHDHEYARRAVPTRNTRRGHNESATPRQGASTRNRTSRSEHVHYGNIRYADPSGSVTGRIALTREQILCCGGTCSLIPPSQQPNNEGNNDASGQPQVQSGMPEGVQSTDSD